MASFLNPARETSALLEPTRHLLEELAQRRHPAAPLLLRAWLIDLLLQGNLSLGEAARIGGVSESALKEWLHQRHLIHLLGFDAPGEGSPRSPEFSVLVPIFNEEENIPELYRRLAAVLQPLGEYEILFVNDGSSDRSSDLVRALRQIDSHVKLISFSRNFGHQAAVTAGIDHCRGKAVMLLDADLQDPPELLVEMIAQWRAGYKVVYAVRKKRKEGFLKRTAYFLFYRLLRALANIEIPLDSGDFCLLDRVVVEQLKRLPERNRFLRGLRSWVGHPQIAVPYERQARHAGAPKYTFRKLMNLALDGVISFSSFPLRVSAYLGFLASLCGILYLAYALVVRMINGAVPPGWTSVVVLILLMGGTQLVLLGVLGEYVARVYDESKQRPTYVVAEVLD